MHRHEHVFVDRRADAEAAVLEVIRGEIGAASADGDAQRASAEGLWRWVEKLLWKSCQEGVPR